MRDFSTVKSLVLNGVGIGDVEYDLFTPREFKRLFVVLHDDSADPYTFLVYRHDLARPVADLMESLVKLYLNLVKQRAKQGD